MQARTGRYIHINFLLIWAVALVLILPTVTRAAPYAALVMDARDGRIIYSKNADTRLHPASLTKMLTLYITFDAIQRGEITLDTIVTVTRHAASQPPSHLGLRPGQKIALRYLIRAAAVKSANDAAAAIGDALSGSEAAFAARMNATAKALGMEHSTFKNANGLTRRGHMSTAHDMAILARHLIYDFPQYYNIFGRTSTYAGVAEVYSTNRKFLRAYDGADGIKTGYTYASGFNLVASAVHGKKRLIGVIFGATSTPARNHEMERMLDANFPKVANNVALRRPDKPDLSRIPNGWPGPSADTLVASSPRPMARPVANGAAEAAVAAAVAATSTALGGAVPAAPAAAPAPATGGVMMAAVAPAPRPAELIQPQGGADPTEVASADPETLSIEPAPRPSYASEAEAVADNDGEAVDPAEVAIAAATSATSVQNIQPASASTVEPPAPKARPEIVFASSDNAPKPAPLKPTTEVISRMSTSGGHGWAITLGHFRSRSAAEKILLRTALAEPTVLDDALRKVVDRKTGFEANFVGLTHHQADLACARLQARSIECFALSP